MDQGAEMGEQIEAEFSRTAKEAGLSEEEAQNAYNRNMSDVGGLSIKPAEYANEHKRRWLVSGYEAGDVVLHNPFTVGLFFWCWTPVRFDARVTC